MSLPTRIRRAAVITGAAVALALLAVACGGDDDDDLDSTPGGGVTSVADPEPDPEADPEAGGGEPEEGVVFPKPDDATQFDVTLSEWEISAPATVAAGKVYFLATNNGPDDAHEMAIIRTDIEPGALPVEDGKVPEDDVDLIGEIEPFAPNSSASLLELDLAPGKYVLICNVAEVEEGELESHYELGMHTGFVVE